MQVQEILLEDRQRLDEVAFIPLVWGIAAFVAANIVADIAIDKIAGLVDYWNKSGWKPTPDNIPNKLEITDAGKTYQYRYNENTGVGTWLTKDSDGVYRATTKSPSEMQNIFSRAVQKKNFNWKKVSQLDFDRAFSVSQMYGKPEYKGKDFKELKNLYDEERRNFPERFKKANALKNGWLGRVGNAFGAVSYLMPLVYLEYAFIMKEVYKQKLNDKEEYYDGDQLKTYDQDKYNSDIRALRVTLQSLIVASIAATGSEMLLKFLGKMWDLVSKRGKGAKLKYVGLGKLNKLWGAIQVGALSGVVLSSSAQEVLAKGIASIPFTETLDEFYAMMWAFFDMSYDEIQDQTGLDDASGEKRRDIETQNPSTIPKEYYQSDQVDTSTSVIDKAVRKFVLP